MTNSSSLLAYPDVKDILQKALDSERGLLLDFKTEKDAFHFLGRCNSYRYLDRKENLKIYPEPAMTLHGRSVFDVLHMSRAGKKVKIVPIKLEDVTVNEL